MTSSSTFVEELPQVAARRHVTTTRVVEWAVQQLRREHATVNGLARQLGTAWHTVWTPVKAVLQALADDPARFDGVRTLGVDEHICHHLSRRQRGPKELTGMVDLTRDEKGEHAGQAPGPGPRPFRDGACAVAHRPRRGLHQHG